MKRYIFPYVLFFAFTSIFIFSKARIAHATNLLPADEGKSDKVFVIHSTSSRDSFLKILNEGLRTRRSLNEENRMQLLAHFPDSNDIVCLHPIAKDESSFRDVITRLDETFIKNQNWVALYVDPNTTYVYDGSLRVDGSSYSRYLNTKVLLSDYINDSNIRRRIDLPEVIYDGDIPPSYFVTNSDIFFHKDCSEQGDSFRQIKALSSSIQPLSLKPHQEDQELEFKYESALNLSYITFHEKGERFVWVPERNQFSIIFNKKYLYDKSKIEKFVNLIIRGYKSNESFAKNLKQANINSIEDLIDRLEKSKK